MTVIVRELCGHRRLQHEWAAGDTDFSLCSQSCYSQMGKGGSPSCNTNITWGNYKQKAPPYIWLDIAHNKVIICTCFFLVHQLSVYDFSADLTYVTCQLFRQFRSDQFIKIINYIGNILANLNKTMQTKQHVTKKKNTLLFKHKQDMLGTIFLSERVFSTKSSWFIQ